MCAVFGNLTASQPQGSAHATTAMTATPGPARIRGAPKTPLAVAAQLRLYKMSDNEKHSLRRR